MPDFFAFSKIIPVLFYPLPFFLIFLFVLSFVSSPSRERPDERFIRQILRIAILVFWFLSTPLVVDNLVKIWESPRKNEAVLSPNYDAALVLGGFSNPSLYQDEHVEFNKSAERISEAVQLYRKGRVKNIIISSGSGELLKSGLAEAPTLVHWVESLGVRQQDIIVEDHSRNTHENAIFSKKLCQIRGIKSILLITSGIHMPRSKAIFEKTGFNSSGFSLATWPVDTQKSSVPLPFNLIPDPTSLEILHSLLKEWIGYLAYGVMGYI